MVVFDSIKSFKKNICWMKRTNGLRKQGFTLAEVLITLGVIGVVAALTIPTLVSSYQEKAWNTSASVFEKKMEDALNIMFAQESLEDCSSTEDFVTELSKNFKVTKICQNYELENCFPEKFVYGLTAYEEVDVSTLTDSSKLKDESYNTNTMGLQFGNGVVAILAYNPSCIDDNYSNQISLTSCVSMIYDTSGRAEPNTVNKDVRMLNVDTLYAFKLDGVKYSSVFPSSSHTWNACNSNGSSDNEADKKIMSTYGIEECYPGDDGTDYWAGAAIACGGADNLPTPENLAAIANYVYNTEDIGGNTNMDGLSFDPQKASSIGFALDGRGSLKLWTKASPVGLLANVRTFESDGTRYNSTDRHYSSPVKILCVIK